MVLEAILFVAEIIKHPIEKYVVLPIKRHLSYAFNYNTKVNDLREVAEQLNDRRVRLEQSVDHARKKGKEIYGNVTRWLDASAKAFEEAQQVVDSEDYEVKKRCFVGLCPNLKSRYQLGKMAEMKASEAHKVLNKNGLDPISYSPPPKQQVTSSVYIPEALPSRVSILKEVMEALKDPNLTLIGVHGMGGVGKTTLAKEVHGQAQLERLFDVVVMVAVSQAPDRKRIQAEIAESLGMELKEEGILLRADRLCDGLKKQKILIILDDIWNDLQLEELGIPVGDGSKGRKILLTSRSLRVLESQMNAQKTFRLEVLPEEEAWSLFEMKVHDAKNQTLPAVAIEVAKRCAGLPLFILKVAVDLRNKDQCTWNDKLMQLSELDNRDIQAKIHSVLEKSYENLSTDQLKSFFLLCGLFGQSNIQIKHLLMYSVGLGIFKHRVTMDEIRDGVSTLIVELKDESLLEDGDMDGHVKMHDVTRDTAMSIAWREQRAFIGSSDLEGNIWPDKDCTRISLLYNDIHEFPEKLECPVTEFLFLNGEGFFPKLHDSFFERVRKLKVLGFNGIYLESLPSSLASLTNLQTLCLHRCELDDLGFIGELKQLKVLSFADSEITELPKQIEQLSKLQLLDLSDCHNLKVIPADALSRLSSLEELYMSSFVYWEVEGNARLSEFECLSCLSILEMHVQDGRILPRNLFMNLSGLHDYKISLGYRWRRRVNNEYSKNLKLKLETNILLEHGVLKLLKETEYLYLRDARGIKNLLYDLDRDGFPKLKRLDVVDNPVIQHVVDSQKWNSTPAFPSLESLFLEHLGKLENLYHGQLAVDSFSKLQVLKIKSCVRLTTVFSVFSKEQEDIVNVEAEDEDDFDGVVELTHLRSLTLKYLPQLKSFCDEKKVLVESREGDREMKAELGEESTSGAQSSLFNPMVSLPSLEDLYIVQICCEKIWQNNISGKTSNLTPLIVYGCHSLKYLFTTAIVESLLRLERLWIDGCDAMEEIICTEGSAEEAEKVSKTVFPELIIMSLCGLAKLKRFCSGYPIEFQSLTKLYIRSCHELMSFVSNVEANSDNSKTESLFDGMVGFPNLKELYLTDMGNLKNIWHSELAPDAFCKLNALVVSECPKLITVFPRNNDLSRFRRLERLKLEKCDSMQEVFQLQRLNDEEMHDVVEFKLRDMTISGLKELRLIWSEDPQSVFIFQELQSIKVDHCKSLKYILPASIGRGLLQLESLVIDDCGAEEVIGKAEGEASDPIFKFPQLNSLKLNRLRNLRSFYPERHSVHWPKLKCLEVRGCRKAILLGSSSIQQQAAANEAGGSQLNILLFPQTFNPNLEELAIHCDDVMRMHFHQFSMQCLCRLKVLELISLNNQFQPFLFRFLERLHHLEKLVVSKAYSEMLFSDEMLPQIKHLEICDSSNLKHIWRQEHRPEPIITVSHVQTLQIRSCDSLISIVHPSTPFQHLAALDVGRCEKLECLVPLSVAKTMMQLKKMRVYDCRNMTEVVESVANHSVDEITFNELRILELESLTNLASFCSRNHAFSFPALEELLVRNCNRMAIFSPGVLNTPKLRRVRKSKDSYEQFWQGNLNETIANLWVKSRHFQLYRNNWHDQHLGRAFHKIEFLTVDGCSLLTKALSINQLKHLNKLKRLVVRGCESVEVVFDLEGTSSIQGHASLLPCLTELQLIDLPMLRDYWNKDPKGILDFKKLECIDIENCSSLRHGFTNTTCFCLENLRQVQLKNCLMMEGLIKNEEVDDEILSTRIFPSLNSIVFERLPNLSIFCEESGNLQFPTLKKVSVYDCPKVKILSSVEQRSKTEVDIHSTLPFYLKVMPNLEELSLDNHSTRMIIQCELPLEFFISVKVVELRFFPPTSYFSLFAFLQRLPNLENFVVKTSSLNHLFLFNGGVADPMIRSCGDLINLVPCYLCFNNLTTLQVRECNKLERLIPLWAAKNMGQLETLRVDSCEMLTEIVGGETDKELDKIVFNKMKKLELYNLHCLKSFNSNGCLFEFPSLENITVSRCPNMTLFCSGVLRIPKLDNVNISSERMWEGDLNATIQKIHMKMVGFRLIEELKLSKFPMLEAKWNGQFPISNLWSVTKLVVDECATISHAIPSNLLQQLDLLKVLVVKKCDSLEEVFDLEDLDSHDVAVERLEELQLINLPRLRHVWNKDPHGILSFNNLQSLKVENCDRLTHIFTLSMVLRLGNLKHIQVERCSLVEHILITEDKEKLWDKTVFPSLESMSLECLPNLLGFYSGNDALKCPSLKKVDVVGCPKMNIFPAWEADSSMIVEFAKIAMPNVEEICVEWNIAKNVLYQGSQIEFFCRLKALKLKCYPCKLPVFPSNFLEKAPNLEIKLVVSDLSLHEFDVSEENHLSSLPLSKVLVSSLSFQNLTTLQVSKCHGLVNLITATVAKSLMRLERMDIMYCEMMQSIVASEADDGVGDDDNEIAFSQLRFLTIHELPSLTIFCSGNFVINFPLLEEVMVRECPNMKTFGYQVMTTPKLWKVRTGEEEYKWEWEGSLNHTIEALFMQLKTEAICMRSSIMGTGSSSQPSCSL